MEQNFYDFITANPVGETTIKILADNMRNVALVFAATFFVIGLLWNYGKTILQKQKFTADWSSIIGSLLIIFLISAYNPIFGGIDQMCNGFNRLIYKAMEHGINQNTKTQFIKMVMHNGSYLDRGQQDYLAKHATDDHFENFDLLSEVKKSTVITEKDGSVKLIPATDQLTTEENDTAFLSSILNAITSLPKIITAYSLNMFLYIIKYAISLLIIATSYVFYIIGPLALVFSLIPMWSDKAESWFSTWITCKLSLTSFIVINTIYECLADNMWSEIIVGGTQQKIGVESYEVNYLVDLGMQLTGIIVYFLVFWLTSQWVGSSNAGKVLTSGMQMATMAMRGAGGGSAPTPTTAPSSGGKSVMDGAANAGKKALDN